MKYIIIFLLDCKKINGMNYFLYQLLQMKHYFIVNPEAGKGKMLASLLTKIRFASEELGIDYTVYNTTTTGDGTRYVKEVCE